ncbi:cyclopropane-fatty-acyl-phospholipid synthase [Aliarcobacter butzleri JV22]|uniref:class I SAM-dependent methyltransferase n=1 Tax=Aliarcobacter butzleri TaxID=28197 RepID=UPI0001F14C50|nr:class I SAM-dependent methyltransferase [Aliarcobacter butzleri]EFU70817.1 cyclopropane-fatty-acyl-phospholipid synthase [Aliarcobacter butzleri JV22]
MNKNSWNADDYSQKASFVSNLAFSLVDILDVKKDEKILDLGCGEGTLTIKIQNQGANVIGIDLSEEMVLKAKEKGIEAFVMSVTDLKFEDESFNKVFSNAVLHWVKDLDKSAKEIARVLKKDGKFVAEFGGYGNIKFLCEAMDDVFSTHKDFGEFNNPWNFISDIEYKKILEKNGFEVHSIELINRPTKIEDIKVWLDIFANGITKDLTTKQKEIFKEEVEKILKNKIYSEEFGWLADYVRLRVVANKL